MVNNRPGSSSYIHYLFISKFFCQADEKPFVSANVAEPVRLNQGDNDGWVIKLNSTGSKVWSKTYGGSQYDDAQCVLFNADGSYWVGGFTSSNNSGDIGANHGAADVWITKIND